MGSMDDLLEWVDRVRLRLRDGSIHNTYTENNETQKHTERLLSILKDAANTFPIKIKALRIDESLNSLRILTNPCHIGTVVSKKDADLGRSISRGFSWTHKWP